MVRPKNIDAAARTHALMEAVIETFKRKGYDGASLADLGLASGIAKASFYHRFPGGKPEIGRAALAESGRRFTRHILRPLQSGDAATVRLNAMLDGVLAYYAGDPQACLMNTMTLGEGGPLFGKDIKHSIAAWEKLMAQAFMDLGATQEDARVRSIDVIVRIQGALVLARMSGREHMLVDVVGGLRA